ncbi:hypothetical protein QF000_007973 [Paraburkholderia atlantica]|uniref:hypothetical protein n=1 Tax=Paraburkholderia atlantica TaxID=2654982 RepID=UPI003D1B128C
MRKVGWLFDELTGHGEEAPTTVMIIGIRQNAPVPDAKAARRVRSTVLSAREDGSLNP